MSADNGIYILECKDQYRVIHAMAIDNLWYSHIDKNNNQLVSTRIVQYFSKSKYTRDINKAREIAFLMAKRQPILEYGINSISMRNKTWNQIIREAKELAPLEIKAIQERGNDGRWDWNIQRLEEIINM